MTLLSDTARATVARFDMLPTDAPVLVMVSGGADSVSLLDLFAAGEFGERAVRVLHVNHLLRGAAADEDEAFVVATCNDAGVPCRTVRYDVAAYAGSFGLNLEDAGRRIRYRFADEELEALCEEHGCSPARGRIAVAHTLDDRIETFFMRAIAGAGTGALGSIAAVRGRVVRPLIECERPAVRAHLRERGVAWREDATNADTSRARALVRAELLPVAERLNPAFRANLARTMDLLADDDALLSNMASTFARDFAEVSEGRVVFGRDWMRTLERTMARRTVREALATAFPDAGRLDSAHIEALVDGLADDAFARDLPGGLRAQVEYDKMAVSYGEAEPVGVAPRLLTLPGIADLGSAGRIVAVPVSALDTSGCADSVVIDATGVTGELTVDGVRPGDRMRPLGMDGTRKLSDMLVDEKVPRRLRPEVPVVRDGDRIVWVAGVRMSHEYRITDSTARAYRLTWERDAAG